MDKKKVIVATILIIILTFMYEFAGQYFIPDIGAYLFEHIMGIFQ